MSFRVDLGLVVEKCLGLRLQASVRVERICKRRQALESGQKCLGFRIQESGRVE